MKLERIGHCTKWQNKERENCPTKYASLSVIPLKNFFLRSPSICAIVDMACTRVFGGHTAATTKRQMCGVLPV